MPFCPKCKNEYEAGVITCADCGAELVEELAYIDMKLIYSFKSERVLNRFLEYLDYSKIETLTNENPDNGEFELYSSPKNETRIQQAFAIFVSVEVAGKTTNNISPSEAEAILNHSAVLTEESDDEDDSEIDDDFEDFFDVDSEEFEVPVDNVTEADVDDEEEDNDDEPSDEDDDDKVSAEDDGFLEELFAEEAVIAMTQMNIRTRGGSSYTSAEFRAKDTLSTGIMLISFGVVGLALVVLSYLEVLALFNSLFSQLVMAVVFVIMLVAGIYSLKSYSARKEEASEEQLLIDSMNQWADLNLTKDVIQQNVPSADSYEETLLYYQSYIGEQLKQAFPDVDDAMTEYLAEEIYSKLFEE